MKPCDANHASCAKGSVLIGGMTGFIESGLPALGASMAKARPLGAALLTVMRVVDSPAWSTALNLSGRTWKLLPRMSSQSRELSESASMSVEKRLDFFLFGGGRAVRGLRRRKLKSPIGSLRREKRVARVVVVDC